MTKDGSAFVTGSLLCVCLCYFIYFFVCLFACHTQHGHRQLFFISVKFFGTFVTKRHNYEKFSEVQAQLCLAVGFLYKDGAVQPRFYGGSVNRPAVPAAWLDGCSADCPVLLFSNHASATLRAVDGAIAKRAFVAVCSPQNPVAGIFRNARRWLAEGHKPVNQAVMAQAVGNKYPWEATAASISRIVSEAVMSS